MTDNQLLIGLKKMLDKAYDLEVYRLVLDNKTITPEVARLIPKQYLQEFVKPGEVDREMEQVLSQRDNSLEWLIKFREVAERVAQKYSGLELYPSIVSTYQDEEGETYEDYYTITEKTGQVISSDGYLREETEEFGSDVECVIEYVLKLDRKLSYQVLTKDKAVAISGAFFPYLNKSEVDLSEHQIYHTRPETDTHCLIHSLRRQGLEIHESLSNSVPRRDLSILARRYNIRISLKYLRDKDTFRTVTYGPVGRPVYKLGLYKGHYLDNSTGIITQIHTLFKQGAFLMTTADQYIELEEGGKDLPSAPSVRQARVIPTKYFCADFETTTDGERHKVYMASFCELVKGSPTTSRLYPDMMLKELIKQSRGYKRVVYFHNLKYDVNFFNRCTTMVSVCKKGSRLYSCVIKYKGVKIELRDSYGLIPYPLSAFGKAFQLETSKQVDFPYHYYVEGFPDYRRDVSEEVERDAREKGLWNEDKGLRMLKYAAWYCENDVKVLRDGMLKFIEESREELGVDPIEHLTVSSMAMKYFRNRGCFEGVCTLRGKDLKFAMGAVYGGRVFTRNNCKVVESDLLDLDAVSLYPTAMNRIEGYPIGKPEWRTTIPQGNEFYIAEIEVMGCTRDISVPLISYRDERGIKVWDNRESTTMTVGKYYYEDLEHFIGMQSTVKRVLYWPEGYNTKVREVVRELFDLRLKYKTEGNQVRQELIKLMLNSGYGKLVEKENTTVYRYFDCADKFHTYRLQMINNVVHASKVGNWYYVETREDDLNHSNYAHCGVAVLDMSKRIVNEVASCFKEVFYGDTDSLFVRRGELESAVKKFKETYNRDLIGSGLGQFHNDFDSGNHTITSVFCAKKIYSHLMDDGSVIIRCKGVTKEALINEFGSPLGVHHAMIKGGEYSFDLTSARPIFRFEKNSGVYSLEEFVRKISF